MTLVRLRDVGEGSATHRLDPAADSDVVDAGGDQGGGDPHRLLGGAALDIERVCRDLVGETGLQPGAASDVQALLTDLLDAAGEDVPDLHRVDPGTVDQLRVGAGEEVGGMEVAVVALLWMAATDRVRSASTITTSRPPISPLPIGIVTLRTDRGAGRVSLHGAATGGPARDSLRHAAAPDFAEILWSSGTTFSPISRRLSSTSSNGIPA
jgi:hypothetical protein